MVSLYWREVALELGERDSSYGKREPIEGEDATCKTNHVKRAKLECSLTIICWGRQRGREERV